MAEEYDLGRQNVTLREDKHGSYLVIGRGPSIEVRSADRGVIADNFDDVPRDKEV